MLSAGKLRDKVAIYSPISVKSESGALVEKVEFQRNVRAQVIKTSNSDSTLNQQQFSTGIYQCMMRLSRVYSVTEGYWILNGDRWLKVIAVDDTDQKRHKLLITAEHNHKSTPPIST